MARRKEEAGQTKGKRGGSEGKIEVTVTAEQHEILRQKAEARGLSLSSFLRMAALQYSSEGPAKQ